MNFDAVKQRFERNGYEILPALYTQDEVNQILRSINTYADANQSSTDKTNLYAIRHVFQKIPNLKEAVFGPALTHVLNKLDGDNLFLIRAVYFDKPAESNWFVPFHQDLTIGVTHKAEVEGYKNWTFKQGCHYAQPPLRILENTITVRIHLDNTNASNGALHVVSGSHDEGVLDKTERDKRLSQSKRCPVEKGGIMLMKPLLLHASKRATTSRQRRVLHLEFNTLSLEKPLEWYEYHQINA